MFHLGDIEGNYLNGSLKILTMVEPLDLGEHANNLGFWCVLFEQTRDPSLLRSFKEEIITAGLEKTDISLLLPEEGTYQLVYTLDPDRMGSATKSGDKKYTVTLYPLALERAKEIFGYDTSRDVIRHELAHIKFGDCDRKFPRGLKWLQRIYNSLIEEPRARAYVHRSTS